MGTKSKPFRIFVEGETISDGRKVSAEMIDECVATFAPATYSPRINIEHVSGYRPGAKHSRCTCWRPSSC